MFGKGYSPAPNVIGVGSISLCRVGVVRGGGVVSYQNDHPVCHGIQSTLDMLTAATFGCVGVEIPVGSQVASEHP
jgi:hypothetical protein